MLEPKAITDADFSARNEAYINDNPNYYNELQTSYFGDIYRDFWWSNVCLLEAAPSLDAGINGLCYDCRDLRLVSEITIRLETMYGCLYRRYARQPIHARPTREIEQLDVLRDWHGRLYNNINAMCFILLIQIC